MPAHSNQFGAMAVESTNLKGIAGLPPLRQGGNLQRLYYL